MGDVSAEYERIILTGFRAVGKSAVGRELARLLGCVFLDTDRELSRELGRGVSDYVRSHGWAAFREQERRLLVRLADRKDLVVAVGGGAVLHRDEWSRLRARSLVVWLRADAETIRQRLRSDDTTGSNRPPLTGEDTLAEVDGLLAEREPLYRAGSDISFDTTTLSPPEIAARINERLRAAA